MKSNEIIKEYQEKYSEWIEMFDEPNQFLIEVMANHIVELKEKIKFLEKLKDYLHAQ